MLHLLMKSNGPFARCVCGFDAYVPSSLLPQDELTGHDVEHRATIRSEIESALRRYLVSGDADARMEGGEGERETPPRVFSTHGGAMAIGCGCFLLRPSKPSHPGDCGPSPATSSRRDDESAADSATPASPSELVPPSETNAKEDAKPVENVSATSSSTDDGAGPPTRSSSLSSGISTISRRVSGEDNLPKVGAEVDAPNVLTSNDEDVSKNQEDNRASDEVVDGEEQSESKNHAVDNPEKATSAIAEVGTGLKSSTPRDSADDSTAQPGDNENGKVESTGTDGELTTPDATLKKSSTIRGDGESSPKLSRNPVLSALLGEMTSAADAWASASAARLAGVGDLERGTEVDTPGCTAIIFLDAPLITPGLNPQPRFLRDRGQAPFTGRQRESSSQAQTAPRESAEPKAAEILSDALAASPHGSRSSDVESSESMESATLDEARDDSDERPDNNDDSDRDAAGLGEQHPAGLGDPSKALESLLAWTGEGFSSGCRRREVLLVCCSGGTPPLSGDEKRGGSVDGESSEMSATAGEDGVGTRGHGENVIRQLLDSRRAHNGDGENVKDPNAEVIVRTNDVDLMLRGKGIGEAPAAGGSEGRVFSSVGEEERGDRPRGAIRQIILGGTDPIQIVPRGNGEKPGVESSNPDRPARHEGPSGRMKVPSVVAGMRTSKGEGRVRSSSTQPEPSFARLPPSEVLLQTLPAAPTGKGLPQISVTFPPAIVTPAAVVPTRETEKLFSRTSLEETFAGDSARSSVSDSVRVVVGPVIGRVSPTSGIVLVEVGSVAAGATRREGSAAVHFSDGVGVRLTDTLTGKTRQMTGGTWTGGQPGNGPRVFEFEGLTPGRRYALRLSGVRRRDQVSRGGLSRIHLHVF